MPFDGSLPLVSGHHTPLSDIFNHLGIKPVTQVVLLEHKAAQCARYPASWTYLHRHKLRAVLVVSSFINMFIAGLGSLTYTSAMVLGTNLPDFLYLVMSVICFNMILAGLFPSLRMHPPAQWYERVLSPDTLKTVRLPREIEQITERICKLYSGSKLSFTYAELRRNVEPLDPYLTVRDAASGEEFVIGIWDADTLLHIAA